MAEKFPKPFGPYRLLKKLAQGGMAEIFVAQDARGDICAIKRILPHLAHEESFIRMFIDEARIVSHLKHPNIAQVYDQGKHDGFYYIAMEFVQGHSLLALFERARSLKMQHPLGLLGYVVAEVLSALGAAHSAVDAKGRHLRIVHRDVTPQNVLVSYSGEVKLIDFGVAKAIARLTATEAGFTKGKLSYMSPEQARGEPLDGRSDLFSAGIILYEITTGSRLFNKEGPGGILGAIVNEPIPAPSQRMRKYPRELEDVVMRALEKRVDERWAYAEEMRDALMRFVRKERPLPGRSRLKDLVLDVFGEPEGQSLIDFARASAERTPEALEEASVSAFGMSRSSPIKADETRMMSPEEIPSSADSRRGAALEVTRDGVPALRPAVVESQVEIPEPRVPWLVRAARFLGALARDLRVSWRTHRRRYLAAFGILGGFLLVGLGVRLGAAGMIGRWVGGGVAAIQGLRAAAKSDQAVAGDADAGYGSLRIVSEPPGAAISVDGLGMGVVTPQELHQLPVGRPVRLGLALPGYTSREEQVTLWPGQEVKTLALTLDRLMGALTVQTSPVGAEVWVNGALKGRSPLTLDGLPADSRVEIEARLPGRKAAKATALVAEGPPQRVQLDLPIEQAERPPGALVIESTPDGCDAFVDGARVGTTPLRGQDLKDGLHEVRVRCEHFNDETQTVRVEAGQESRVTFALTPVDFGYITVRVEPTVAGTTIRIDGEALALPVEFRRVMPGRHEIVVENETLLRRKAFTVDVKPGARIERIVHLHR
ncbi:MAG: PEGA domain-containing protein [Deltaproteobacteria bacterium]|nr:PEGA domain-containing protein [Deltaproteobacteria bacterium]